MAYFIMTHHNEWTLSMNDRQLARLRDLLAADQSDEAAQLQKVINSGSAQQRKRRTLVSRKIDLCKTCGGAKKIKVNITGTYEHDYEECYDCEGEGGEVVTTIIYREPLTGDKQNEFAPYPGQKV